MNPTEITSTTQSSEATEPSEPAWVPQGADYKSDRDFVDFPLSAEVQKGIADLGYITATPVQAAMIEPALAGRDLIVRSKTGTGKTAAFCIPLAERIPAGERVPRALILSPTRELAQQTATEIAALTKHKDLTTAVLVGGVPMGPQERALAEGASVIAGTPGRILDHLRRGNLDLRACQIVVLDEADEMFSMGFLEDVTTILDKCPPNSQKLMVSATVDANAQRVIDRFLRDPENLMLSHDGEQVEGIEHVLYEVPVGAHRVRALLSLIDLEDPASAIVFTNTREDAATVAAFLDRQGLDVQLLSGELPQSRRDKVMKLVKAGAVRFLVATDVAARGIDISDLSHVIQYSLPQDPAIYLHRTGRTGRIGKKGTAIALVGGTDLGTKRTLEGQHRIKFVPKPFPPAEECIARRVERQATQIRDAMGSIAFEAYLPTAKALMARPDGDILISAALRAFFQWDRTRRAAITAGPEDENNPQAAQEMGGTRPKKEPRERDRAERSDRPEKRGDRPERSSTRERDRGDRKDRDRERPPRRERAPKAAVASIDDLDALLSSGDDDLSTLLVSDDAPALDAPETAPAADAAPSDDAGEKKKPRKKRTRTKKSDDAPAGELDSMLAVDSDGGSDAKPAESAVGDDLDSLLSMD